MRILYKIANKLFRIVKKILKLLTSRMVIIGVALLLEFCWLAGIMMQLNEKSVYINYAVTILSLIAVLSIINNPKMNPGYKLMWAVCILALPVTGICLYGILGHSSVARKFRTHYDTVLLSQGGVLGEEEETRKKLEEENILAAGQSSYLTNYAHYPVYVNTETEYYPLGDVWFEHFIEELKKAEHYIFMEYFIIEEGFMFNSILSILEEKVKQGVEVRIMYDDMGSLGTLPASYAKQLEKKGIKAVSFNRISPIINTIMNHRDHRKILIIDGKVAFSGGANLADEYINKKVKHGHWMDNIICIKGKAVWSYLVMFLTNWNALRHEDFDYSVFKNEDVVDETLFDGYIAPYAETPLDEELTGQSVYEDLLNSANKYVYIMTPYLIIDSEMINTLIHTAKKGVDVRIIMPGIADKQIVHDMGTTYYKQLIQGGVKIHEYEPGFVHSKVFICDDTYATVGTINLDYRSLYQHFENGTLLYKSKKIMDVKQNFFDTLEHCKKIQVDDTHVNIVKGLFLSIIRIFSPLL